MKDSFFCERLFISVKRTLWMDANLILQMWKIITRNAIILRENHRTSWACPHQSDHACHHSSDITYPHLPILSRFSTHVDTDVCLQLRLPSLFDSDFWHRLLRLNFFDSNSRLQLHCSKLFNSFRNRLTAPTPLQKWSFVSEFDLLVFKQHVICTKQAYVLEKF